MAKPRVAIVGAGLGGLSAAIMLQRAGFPVTVYEQAPQLERLGAGINLGANVMRVADHMGLVDAMYAQGLQPDRSLSREWDTGRVLFDYPTDAWAEAYGYRNLIMHRGDLQAILASGVTEDTIVFGKRLTGFEPGAGDSVRLHFDDGSAAEADVLIGADGVNSKVREEIFGAQEPTYTGYVAYRCILPTERLGAPLEVDYSKWWSDDRLPSREDRHFIIYHLTERRDEVYYVTGSPAPNWDPSVSNVPVTIDEILECYEGFHEEVQRVIRASVNPTKWPLLTRDPMKTWRDGSAVLLGDACHPMKPHMGQGANMAMEDGVVLARCLETFDGDIQTAFDSYHATRIDRVTRVQAESSVNVWLRDETDPTWVFGYDPLSDPLKTSKDQVNLYASEREDV